MRYRTGWPVQPKTRGNHHGIHRQAAPRRLRPHRLPHADLRHRPRRQPRARRRRAAARGPAGLARAMNTGTYTNRGEEVPLGLESALPYLADYTPPPNRDRIARTNPT